VLSDRLKGLEEHGVIARRFYSDHPPRAEYALTERGRELGIVVGALAVWGSRHVHRQSALVHADCETPVEVGYYCGQCGERVRGSAVRLTRARRARRPARTARATPASSRVRSRGPAAR
jgi:hypothetical protein